MFDLEAKVKNILAQGAGVEVPAMSGSARLSEVLYLDLAENIVRQAVHWQYPDGGETRFGMIGDPYNEKGVESITTTARYTAAVGHLLRAGRCLDLLDSGTRAMNWCCRQFDEHLQRQ